LAERRVLMSHSDAKIIGFEAAFKLAHICIGSRGDKPPLSGKLSSNKDYHWVEPQVAVAFDEEFQELTQEASMYAPNLNQD